MSTENKKGDAQELIKMQGRKLAVLLNNSDMPDDVKEAWIAVLPKLSIEQIDRFIAVLEEVYLDKVGKEVDFDFEEKMKGIVKDYEDEKEKIKSDVSDKLKSFSENLKA